MTQNTKSTNKAPRRNTELENLPELSKYETFAVYCLPKLIPGIAEKIRTHTRIIPVTELQETLKALKCSEIYCNLIHTSSKQIATDLGRVRYIPEIEVPRYIIQVREARDFSVAIITREFKATWRG